MVYQVMREDANCVVALEKFGSRILAEEFIGRYKPAAKRKKLFIREVTIPDDSPALNYPYLPGVGH